MKNLLGEFDKEQHRHTLFDDNWHVNDLGHKIYAECAYEAIYKTIKLEER